MLNYCTFIGNLTRDPEQRCTPGGDPVCNFSIACNEKFKGKDGQQKEKTEFINLVVWGKLAEICGKYLTKGKQVYVAGKMETRKWEKGGITRYSTEINVKEMKMLSSVASGPTQGGTVAHEESHPVFGDEDCPF